MKKTFNEMKLFQVKPDRLEQFDAYQVNTAMIFGIAGGNGLEHVSKEKYVHNAKAVKNRPLSVCGSGLSLVVR